MAMTSNQRDDILRSLKCKLPSRDCDIRYDGRKGDFFLFRRTVKGFFRQLCLKERSVLIVYYSDEYDAMRKWASNNLPQILAKSPCLKGWKLEIGISRPQGDKAVGFRLRNDTLAANASSWYCNREAIVSAAAELFGILDKSGYFR